MNRVHRIRGLYAITDPATCADDLARKAEAVLRGGAHLLQYRDKSCDHERRYREAHALRALCRRYDALFLVNDDPDLAQRVAADGVHVGQQDHAVADLRAKLGDQVIIGVSCHDSLQLAQAAQAAGADYVAVGALFDSTTKPNARRASLLSLQTICTSIRLPVVAIGGINADNAVAARAAGAAAVAAIHALFGAADPEAAARRICTAMQSPVKVS